MYNWSVDNGENVMRSILESNLSVSEDVIVFVEHNYSSGGLKTVTVNGTTANDIDSEQTTVRIG